jgi:phospholipid/cholesterol/gamma-HCH transport system permease protein
LAEASPRTPAPIPVAGAFSVACEWTGELTLLFLRSLDAIARGKVKLEETVRQMSLIGVSSLPISTMIMAFSGMVLALHTANQLKRLGLEGLVGGIVAVSGAREAAPVLTAVAVAARVGSAIAAELGTMAVTEQVDALRSLGVSPVRYLVGPRLVAAILMLPIVTIFANAAGILGGLLFASTLAGITPETYINSVRTMLQPDDLYRGLLKTFVFGAIIATVGCLQGLRTTGGAAGVGKSTTSAVVISIVLVYIADFFLAAWLFGDSAFLYR